MSAEPVQPDAAALLTDAQARIGALLRDTMAARAAVWQAMQAAGEGDKEPLLLAHGDLQAITGDVNRVRVMVRASYPTLEYRSG